MIEHDQTFPAAFIVREADPASAYPSEVRFVADGTSSLAPVFEIEVQRKNGECWQGSFYGGSNGLTRVLNGSGPSFLIGIAAGAAYLVPIDDPGSYEVLPIRPVQAAFRSSTARVVVLAGYTTLLAVGPEGRPQWTSERLTSDGFSEVRLTADSVVVRGFHAPSHGDVEITLSLETGEILERR